MLRPEVDKCIYVTIFILKYYLEYHITKYYLEYDIERCIISEMILQM